MSFPDPTLILPHKDPFLFISKITDLVPSESAEAYGFLKVPNIFSKATFGAQRFRVF